MASGLRVHPLPCRPHLPPKVTFADKVMIVTRREEHEQEAGNSNGPTAEVTSHLAGGSAHTDPSPSGFLPDNFLDHALYLLSLIGQCLPQCTAL